MTDRLAAETARADGEGCGAPDSVRSREVEYRFDEARRSARPLSASDPPGGPVQALTGPGSGCFQQAPTVEEDGLTPRTPFCLRPRRRRAGLVSEPDPRTVRVSPSNLSPLDRPPKPRRSLAARPPQCFEVGRGYGRFGRGGRSGANARAALVNLSPAAVIPHIKRGMTTIRGGLGFGARGFTGVQLYFAENRSIAGVAGTPSTDRKFWNRALLKPIQ